VTLRALLPVVFAAAIGVSAESRAETFCVSSSAELQDALSEAASNGEDDLIQLAAFTFIGTTGTTAFTYVTNQNLDLIIIGGYLDSGSFCQPLQGAVSRLDGAGARRVMLLDGGSGSGDITVRNVVIQNGDTNGGGGGLLIGRDGYRGDVTVYRVLFDGNEADSSGGALLISTEGQVDMNNSIFIANASETNGGAAKFNVTSQSSTLVRLRVAHNTVYGNGCSVAAPPSCDTGGFAREGTARGAIYNNAFFGNEGADLRLAGVATTTVAGNNIGTIVGQAPLASYANIDVVDPGFTNPTGNPPDFRLIDSSLLIDAGTDDFPIPTFDYDGYPRPQSTGPDIGAFEVQGLRFADGFEAL
jgi:hypothetical protein